MPVPIKLECVEPALVTDKLQQKSTSILIVKPLWVPSNLETFEVFIIERHNKVHETLALFCTLWIANDRHVLDWIFWPRLGLYGVFQQRRSIAILFISVENLLLSKWLYNLLLLSYLLAALNCFIIIVLLFRLSDVEDIPHKLVHDLLRLLQQILRVHYRERSDLIAET